MVAPEFFGVEFTDQLGPYVAGAAVQEYGWLAGRVLIQRLQDNDEDIDRAAIRIIPVLFDAEHIAGLAGCSSKSPAVTGP